jgi:hypothetical protein
VGREPRQAIANSVAEGLPRTLGVDFVFIRVEATSFDPFSVIDELLATMLAVRRASMTEAA